MSDVVSRSTYGGTVKLKRYKLRKPLVDAEEVLDAQGPERIEFSTDTYEVLIELGPDHTGRLIIPATAPSALPDLFEELPDRMSRS